MKKSKSKALAKKAKKSAFKDIKIKLVNELTEVTAKLGKSSKKLRKTIQKESKKFARILSKELKLKKTYSQTSESVRAVAQQPVVLPAKIAQPVTNSAPSENTPVRKRTAVKTAAPARATAKKITTTPVTRPKAVKKLQGQV